MAHLDQHPASKTIPLSVLITVLYFRNLLATLIHGKSVGCPHTVLLDRDAVFPTPAKQTFTSLGMTAMTKRCTWAWEAPALAVRSADLPLIARPRWRIGR